MLGPVQVCWFLESAGSNTLDVLRNLHHRLELNEASLKSFPGLGEISVRDQCSELAQSLHASGEELQRLLVIIEDEQQALALEQGVTSSAAPFTELFLTKLEFYPVARAMAIQTLEQLSKPKNAFHFDYGYTPWIFTFCTNISSLGSFQSWSIVIGFTAAAFIMTLISQRLLERTGNIALVLLLTLVMFVTNAVYHILGENAPKSKAVKILMQALFWAYFTLFALGIQSLSGGLIRDQFTTNYALGSTLTNFLRNAKTAVSWTYKCFQPVYDKALSFKTGYINSVLIFGILILFLFCIKETNKESLAPFGGVYPGEQVAQVQQQEQLQQAQPPVEVGNELDEDNNYELEDQLPVGAMDPGGQAEAVHELNADEDEEGE